VAAPGLGKILVVWRDNRTEDLGGPANVVAAGRFVDMNGTPIGTDFVVVPDGPSFVSKPTGLAYNSKDNTFIIAWEDGRGASWDVWAQRLDANGAIIGSESKVNDQEFGSEYDIDVAYNPVIDKSMFVWWANTDMSLVKARIMNSDGTFDGGQFDVPGAHQPFVAASRVTDEFIVHGADGVIIKVPSQ
jgi:hypothetical protein